jgi:hypothetical protein
VRGWCPPKLEEVLAACLAKDASDRPANARELAARLRAIEIPAEHAWTADTAREWWDAYRPPIPATPLSASNVQVIMPESTKERPGIAMSADAIGTTIARSD